MCVLWCGSYVSRAEGQPRACTPALHARYPCAPTFYTVCVTWGSLSTWSTGIEPDSVPTARLPESEPEQCHTCSYGRCRQRKVEEGQGWWQDATSFFLQLGSPSTMSPTEGD